MVLVLKNEQMEDLLPMSEEIEAIAAREDVRSAKAARKWQDEP